MCERGVVAFSPPDGQYTVRINFLSAQILIKLFCVQVFENLTKDFPKLDVPLTSTPFVHDSVRFFSF